MDKREDAGGIDDILENACPYCLEPEEYKTLKEGRSDKRGDYQADSEEEEDLSLVEQVLEKRVKVKMIQIKPIQAPEGERKEKKKTRNSQGLSRNVMWIIYVCRTRRTTRMQSM